jgi:CDP-diacylglycerol--glycerol-3-phosphate 3-phosphatidyltransferase
MINRHKEKLLNVPNALTALRVFLAFFLIVLYFANYSILTVLIFFIIAALTDFFDGFFARRLNQETYFGARFDILADRILWVLFGIILIFGYPSQRYYNLLDFLMIFSREILCGIFLVFYILLSKQKKIFPFVRYGGKIETVLQGIIIPSMVLSDYFSFFMFYKSLLVICLFLGIVNFFYYSGDLLFSKKIKNTQFWRTYNYLNPVAPAPYQESME